MFSYLLLAALGRVLVVFGLNSRRGVLEVYLLGLNFDFSTSRFVAGVF